MASQWSHFPKEGPFPKKSSLIDSFRLHFFSVQYNTQANGWIDNHTAIWWILISSCKVMWYSSASLVVVVHGILKYLYTLRREHICSAGLTFFQPLKSCDTTLAFTDNHSCS